MTHRSPEVALAPALRAILDRGDLGSKLAPVPRLAPEAGASVGSVEPPPDRPARNAGLAMGPGAGALPKPGRLGEPEARACCLARFAHHELMAVELLAWALLRWPDLPSGLARALLGVLGDEQRHCRLYLARLEDHGARLDSFAPHSDYFWKHVPAMAAGGPGAFLAGLGLTLEQANLDFAALYRDAFRSAGDELSARVLEQVHADEINHVRIAARGLRELAPEDSDVERYERSVPFPLSAARAKGRRFDEPARRKAGLEPEFIDHVRRAGPSPSRGDP